MANGLDYRDPQADLAAQSSSAPAGLQLLRNNVITAACAAAIVLANLVPAVMALFDRDGKSLILSPCLNFTLAPISLLLTPFVWTRSDQFCQRDSSRYLLLLLHLFVSVALPPLCQFAALELAFWIRGA